MPDHRVHTEWQCPLPTFHHDGKISPGWCGWGVYVYTLSIYQQSRTKLWCMPQLRGKVHSPMSTLFLYVLCVRDYHKCPHNIPLLGITSFQMLCLIIKITYLTVQKNCKNKKRHAATSFSNCLKVVNSLKCKANLFFFPSVWKTLTLLKITINVPVVYMARDVMILMVANPFR
jgi:hypothetical protein